MKAKKPGGGKMPKKKFVWETNLRTNIIEARKERTWKEMENRGR